MHRLKFSQAVYNGAVLNVSSLVNKTNLVHNFFLSIFVLFQSLHVSADYGSIIRRNNCVFAALGTCNSVWMTVWYAGAYAPSSGETTVFLRHLVLVILCG